MDKGNKMTENEEFIYESIFNQVRMGFLSLDEIKENILEEIEDNEFEDEISEQWANDLIDNEYQKVLTESEKWSKPTDTDRLITAFDELCKENIIALHNAGYTTSDGEYEVVQVEQELNDRRKASTGYCFYHEQDLSRAVITEDPSLYIAFQKINNSNVDVTIAVGKKVAEILKKNGFEVKWNEQATTKILIPDFKWQLLYDESNRDLLNYENVVELMTE
ncbi:DUF6891 domain-containing protein [Flavobacterium chilense]|uniref:DUF6891 domain-containing protein n=1 Tax=Flavobacterium chilense TaxID=946677 RepID=A0A1M7HL75_9FLAO|nr:hypothetical protein [Flavobacterium chilense]SHM28877.1 hypothetical protein SAMN05444484_10521 [Flavobacterium chilense]